MNAEPKPIALRPRSRRLRWTVPALLVLIAVALFAAGLIANEHRTGGLRPMRQPVRTSALEPATAVAPLNIVRPLTPEDAIKANQERPFNAAPDTPAKAFKLRADATSRDRAIECLAQAVYYEAASESAEGQEAVAQVVLNRMRHPGFPASVCGVVYQGSELPTGCQFTFTCDGSLARTPIASLWARARKIALNALSGHVFAPVGHATHYHADYVLPYWADSLAKQVQIGHHIFYRLRGSLGGETAFSQRYAGKEPDLPPAPSAVAVATQATDQAQALLNSGLSGDAPPKVAADAAGTAAAGEPKRVLLADAHKGTLLVDKGVAPVTASKTRQSQDCPELASKRMLPLAPDNLHASSSDSGC